MSRNFIHDFGDRVSEILLSADAQDRDWSLIDYPMHLNCGDAALYLGATAAARKVGSRITSTFDRAGYSASGVPREGVVALQAGGNWGGLYPTHHALRLKVLADHPRRPVIQLPQSIEYASESHREELRRAVGRHRNFTMLVRDRRSYDLAVRDYDCRVELVPDLAFALGPLDREVAQGPTTVQARVDRESNATAETAPGVLAGTWDWLSVEPRSRGAVLLNSAARSNRLQRRTSLLRRPSLLLANRLAEDSLNRARLLLSQGEIAVTDRLHGHILCTLMSIPHVVVNDKFGKIRAFVETWTESFPTHEFVSNWADVGTGIERLSGRF